MIQALVWRQDQFFSNMFEVRDDPLVKWSDKVIQWMDFFGKINDDWIGKNGVLPLMEEFLHHLGCTKP